MNKVLLMGRLTKDAELRSNGEHTVARFTLAVDRRGKEKSTDFINVVAFGKTAEFVDKYVGKGTKVVVEGNIKTGSYEGKDGKRVYTTDVIAEQVEFAESKKSDSADSAPADIDGFMNVGDEPADLPFV